MFQIQKIYSTDKEIITIENKLDLDANLKEEKDPTHIKEKMMKD